MAGPIHEALPPRRPVVLPPEQACNFPAKREYLEFLGLDRERAMEWGRAQITGSTPGEDPTIYDRKIYYVVRTGGKFDLIMARDVLGMGEPTQIWNPLVKPHDPQVLELAVDGEPKEMVIIPAGPTGPPVGGEGIYFLDPANPQMAWVFEVTTLTGGGQMTTASILEKPRIYSYPDQGGLRYGGTFGDPNDPDFSFIFISDKQDLRRGSQKDNRAITPRDWLWIVDWTRGVNYRGLAVDQDSDSGEIAIAYLSHRRGRSGGEAWFQRHSGFEWETPVGLPIADVSASANLRRVPGMPRTLSPGMNRNNKNGSFLGRKPWALAHGASLLSSQESEAGREYLLLVWERGGAVVKTARWQGNAEVITQGQFEAPEAVSGALVFPGERGWEIEFTGQSGIVSRHLSLDSELDDFWLHPFHLIVDEVLPVEKFAYDPSARYFAVGTSDKLTYWGSVQDGVIFLPFVIK